MKTIIAAPATHAVRNYNIIHLIHHIANFSYTTSLPCKNELDAPNTLLLDYVASMVAQQTVATYVAIEHINLDSYLTRVGVLTQEIINNLKPRPN